MFDDINEIKNDISNKRKHDVFIHHIVNMMEYTVARNDKIFSKQMLDFMIDLFMIIGELDYDTIEPVLNTLTTSRILLKKLIE